MKGAALFFRHHKDSIRKCLTIFVRHDKLKTEFYKAGVFPERILNLEGFRL
jgi:hypothetical protein